MTERQVYKYKYMTNILYNVKVLSIKLKLNIKKKENPRHLRPAKINLTYNI